jgi:hypothetical protein
MDNGVGREFSRSLNATHRQSHRSHGLHMTEERLELHNREQFFGTKIETHDLHDASGNPTGTRVTLAIAL